MHQTTNEWNGISESLSVAWGREKIENRLITTIFDNKAKYKMQLHQGVKMTPTPDQLGFL